MLRLVTARIKPVLIIAVFLSLSVLPRPARSQGAAGAVPYAAPSQSDFPRRVAVYVAGGVTDHEKSVIGGYLLVSLVNTGACVSHENAAAFLAAADDWSKRGIVIDDNRLSELGRHYGIKYVCAASVTPAFGIPGHYTIFARMLNTETGKARLNGDASGSMRTQEELTLAANTIAEKMLGRRAAPPQTPPPQQADRPATVPQPAAPPQTPQQPAPAVAYTPPTAQAVPYTPTTAHPENAAQTNKTLAVYMAGEDPDEAEGVHAIIGGEIARVLNESGIYSATDRTRMILEQIVPQRSSAVDDDQIRTIGHRLGVRYLCVSTINPAGKRYSLDTRIVDAATAEITRSAATASNLKNADEMLRVGRNIALDLLKYDKPANRDGRRRVGQIGQSGGGGGGKTIWRGTAIGLDVLGAAVLVYGYVEDRNVVKLINKTDYPNADKSATRRNALYIAGGALLASGVTIHIVF